MILICPKRNNNCGNCNHKFSHEENIECRDSRCSKVGYIDCIIDIKEIRKFKLLKLKNDKLSDT